MFNKVNVSIINNTKVVETFIEILKIHNMNNTIRVKLSSKININNHIKRVKVPQVQ